MLMVCVVFGGGDVLDRGMGWFGLKRFFSNSISYLFITRFFCSELAELRILAPTFLLLYIIYKNKPISLQTPGCPSVDS